MKVISFYKFRVWEETGDMGWLEIVSMYLINEVLDRSLAEAPWEMFR